MCMLTACFMLHLIDKGTLRKPAWKSMFVSLRIYFRILTRIFQILFNQNSFREKNLSTRTFELLSR